MPERPENMRQGCLQSRLSVAALAFWMRLPAALYAYPRRGQNPQQAATDQSDCGAWASQQTGFDPKAPVGSSSQAGAAGASSPAGVFGGIQRREERRDLRRQQLAGQGAAVSQQDGYMRALNACLTARGYTVR